MNPEVAMLWEKVDAAAALTERFGFADGAQAGAWVLEAVRGAWAVEVDECDRLVLSDRNVMAWLRGPGGRYVAKACCSPLRFARLADAARLVAWLGAEGLPVAASVPTPDGQVQLEPWSGPDGRALSLVLQPAVEGALLDVEDPEQLAQAGATLARLHAAMAGYPGDIVDVRPGAGEQLVHHDFRSANVLHDGERIVAVLDFEEVQARPRAADLARAAVFLATRYHDWRPTTRDQREAFVDAYEAVTPLTGAERAVADWCVAVELAAMGWS